MSPKIIFWNLSKNTMKKWTEADVLEYIKEHNIELPSIYKYLSRTGCMFCLFGAGKEKNDRFAVLKKLHPEIYNYFWEKKGFKEVYDYIYKKGDKQ